MPSFTPARVIRRLAALGALVLLLGGCAARPPVDIDGPKAHGRESTESVSFVVVGDSISAWTNVANPSWVSNATAPRVVFRGGWAVPGASTADMVTGLDASRRKFSADVLVVMAGTNDFLAEHPEWTLEQSLANLTGIVARVDARRVVVSAIAPNDLRPAATTAFNNAVAELATREGWLWVDPWQQVRAEGGGYDVGTTVDGIHPTATVESSVGHRLRKVILLEGFELQRLDD